MRRLFIGALGLTAIATAACSREPRPASAGDPAAARAVARPESPPPSPPLLPARRQLPLPAGAGRAAGTGDDAPSVTVLREALQSPDYETRLIAIEALGSVRHFDATPWLEHALGDPEHDVRVAAIESLRRVATPRARAALVSVRDDTTEALGIRALAASALLSEPERR